MAGFLLECVAGFVGIRSWLKSGNEPRLRAIGCETIYAFIYRTGQKAEALWRYLTRRHKRRRPRRARASRDTIKDRASIHDRPKTIESRGEAGHWEGDLIICKCTGPCSFCMSVSHADRAKTAGIRGEAARRASGEGIGAFGPHRPRLTRPKRRPGPQCTQIEPRDPPQAATAAVMASTPRMLSARRKL